MTIYNIAREHGLEQRLLTSPEMRYRSILLPDSPVGQQITVPAGPLEEAGLAP